MFLLVIFIVVMIKDTTCCLVRTMYYFGTIVVPIICTGITPEQTACVGGAFVFAFTAENTFKGSLLISFFEVKKTRLVYAVPILVLLSSVLREHLE